MDKYIEARIGLPGSGASARLSRGGEGSRLRSLTRRITGHDVPKQFCSVLGEESLLEQTPYRASFAIEPRMTLVAVTRGHEHFYSNATGLYGLLGIRLTVYRGKPIDLLDSTHIDAGAMVCELHYENNAILGFCRRSSAIYAVGRRELSAIADWLIQSDTHAEAVFGVTMLGAAAARLGFYRRPVPLTRRERANRLFMNGLLALYSVDGVPRLKRGGFLKRGRRKFGCRVRSCCDDMVRCT